MATTKPGKYGPLYLYEYTYRDVSGDPTFSARSTRASTSKRSSTRRRMRTDGRL